MSEVKSETAKGKSETNLKAFACYLPFERYGAIIKFAEKAGKARYLTLLSAYDSGFLKRDLEIMDIKVYRESALDDFPQVENMSLKEAYRKKAELEAENRNQ